MKKVVVAVVLLLCAMGLSLTACGGGRERKLETPSAPQIYDKEIVFFINGEFDGNAEYACEAEVNGAIYKLTHDGTLSVYDFGTGEISVRFKRLGFREFADSDWSEYLTFTVEELDKPTGFVTKSDRIEWDDDFESYECYADGEVHSLYDHSYISASLLMPGKTEGTYTIKVRKAGFSDKLELSPWEEYSYTVGKHDAPTVWAEKGDILWDGESPGAYDVSVNGEEPYETYHRASNVLFFNQSAEISFLIRRQASGFLLASDWTEFILNRTKIAPVTNLSIEDGVVSWDEGSSSATEYRVRVTLPDGEGFVAAVAENYYSLDTTIIDFALLGAEGIRIEVAACPFRDNYHILAESDYVLAGEISIDYTLDAPVLDRIENDGGSNVNIYWSPVSGATEYYLMMNYSGGAKSYLSTNDDCFAMSQNSENMQTARIVAISYSENGVSVSVSEEFSIPDNK